MSQERQLLASFVANFKKGKKVSDPIQYAKVCRSLVEMYGSPEDVAKKLGIGKETVRILSKIVELPAEVQQMISQRKIPITVGFDLVPLSRDKQIEAAKAIAGLSFKDARRIIRRISENPEKPIGDIRDEVLGELEQREVDVVMIALPKESYAMLQQESRDVPTLIVRIVEDALEKDTVDSNLRFASQELVSLSVRFPRRTFAALRKRSRNPANLVERIIMSWLKRKGKSE